jgi:hypothetical protein
VAINNLNINHHYGSLGYELVPTVKNVKLSCKFIKQEDDDEGKVNKFINKFIITQAY